jgi:cholesterol transport system auxiliary component
MNAMRSAIAMCLGLGLAGCSLLSDTRGEQSIWGLAAATPTAGTTPVVWQLVIDEPAAAAALAGNRIALTPGDGSWGVMRGARWDDSAPRLVQTLLLRAFEDSKRIVGVGRGGASVRGDYLLLTELRGFHVERGGADTAKVSIGAKLVHFKSNQVLAAQVFDASAAIDASGIAAVVAAFQSATNQTLPQIVDWTLDAGEAAQRAAASESGG